MIQRTKGWTLVTDELPGLDDYPTGRLIGNRVLGFNARNNDLIVVTLMREVDSTMYWYCRQVGKLSYEYVTHWMPIPAIP